MAESWQTIEQAAVSLRLSVRTVNRHIAAGKLESRLNDGRREVLVDTSSVPGAAGGSPSGASPFADGPTASAVSGIPSDFADHTSVSTSAMSQFSQQQQQPQSTALTLDQETVLALADNAAEKAEMAVTAYQALARVADTQAQQVRRNARLAWAAVAGMAVAGAGAIGVMTHRVTRLSAERDGLIEKVAERAQAADKLSAERETLRAELESKQQALRAELEAQQAALRAEAAAAREQAARSEGKLAAIEEQEQARQTRAAVMAVAPVLRDDSIFSRLTLNPTGTPFDAATDTSGATGNPLEFQSSDPSDAATDIARAASADRVAPSDDLPARASSDVSEAVAGVPSLATSQPTIALERADAAKPKSARAPTTRPATPRRRVRQPAPRSEPASDTSPAPTTDDR